MHSYRIGSEVVDDFKLVMEALVVDDRQPFPVDRDPFIAVSIKVSSEGFSGKADLEVSVKKFGNFTVDLKNLYDSLKGSARLEEPYFPNQFIEFIVKKTGRVVVKGTIRECYPWSHTLTFENEIDQTYLQVFAKELFADFGQYAEAKRQSPTSGPKRRRFWRRRQEDK